MRGAASSCCLSAAAGRRRLCASPAARDRPIGGAASRTRTPDRCSAPTRCNTTSELGLIVANGHVEISQNDQVLLADTVTYNQRTDTVTASGHVSLLQPTGDIIFADFVELHDDMSDGFVKNVRMLLADRSRLAGNTARRIDGNRTELRRGVYSPCDLCREDPTRRRSGRSRPREIVHDKELQIVEFRDAVMEIDGLPVFYSPYFSHPDPSVKRASGFLAPTFGSSSTLGFHFTIPYYWVIGPGQGHDASGPMLTTERAARSSATSIASASATARRRRRQHHLGSKASSDATDTAPRRAACAAISSRIGELDLTDDWRTGLDIQRDSDQTYLLRYRICRRRPTSDSQVYRRGFGRSSYANISA